MFCIIERTSNCFSENKSNPGRPSPPCSWPKKMQPLKIISPEKLIDLLEIIHQCTLCNNHDNFHDIIKKVCSLLSANSAILCEFLAERNSLQPIRVKNVNFPAEWVDLYARDKLWHAASITQGNRLKPGFQSWENTYKKFAFQPDFISCAQDVGLFKGYTFSDWQHSPDSIKTISLAGNNLGNHQQTNLLMERLAPHLFPLFKRLTPKIIPSQPLQKSPNLTPREREVLNWIKEGKTSWEASIILSISERTVNFHIRNIKRKLNAVNRSQAIAKAISHGIIDT